MKKLISVTTLLFCVSCANLNNTNNTGGSDSSSDKEAKNTNVLTYKASPSKPLINVLIIDGQNNHSVWPKSTVMMQQYLEDSGLFTVDVYRTKPTWNGEKHPNYYALHSNDTHFSVSTPQVDTSFAPEFNNYDVVVANFGYKAAAWPKDTQISFENYMKNGGGFVSVHAADNAFPEWLEYNKMIGLGGWGQRNEKNGPYVYYDDKGVLMTDNQKGAGGTHGPRHEFTITQRNEHPILQDLPKEWMHTKDECYGNLRGPAENLTIIATAHCPKTGKNEPMLMTVNYAEGRVFHTTLGHEDYSLESVGFITTFLRGTEWAATGQVTQSTPSDFPTKNNSSKRQFNLIPHEIENLDEVKSSAQ